MRAPGGKLRMEVCKCHLSCSRFDIEVVENLMSELLKFAICRISSTQILNAYYFDV